MENPLVSVIIPAHNRQNYIARAIKSVQDQDYKNTEIIVIDDASKDNTYGVVFDLAKVDSRIIALKNEKNMGLVKTLNRAISISKGKYIARLDDHDFWNNNQKLSAQIEFLEKNPNYALVGTGAVRVNEENKEEARYSLPQKDEDIRKYLLVINSFVHISVVFTKEIFQKVGGYDEAFDGLEDWDLWLKIGKVSKFYNIPDFFVSYIGHSKSNIGYAATAFKRKHQLKTTITLIKKYRNDYPGYIKAIFFAWGTYIYSFMPFKYALQSLLYTIKVRLLKITS